VRCGAIGASSRDVQSHRITPLQVSDEERISGAPTVLVEASGEDSVRSREGARFPVGTLISETYEITAVLGVGGMGVVYEAKDLGLNRVVALKFALTEQDALTLRKEAQGLAALRHPNLVGIYSLGRHHGHDYMVMERIHGVTLEQRIDEAWKKREPIPLDEVLDLLVAITDALTAVHRAGIVHHDIKSANVMVTASRVVLMDFGLVTPEFAVKRGKLIAGSIDYIAPEIITNSIKPGSGHLVDLYALGVLAFELLTGRPPFWSESPQATFVAHLGAPVPDVRAVRSDVPPKLAELIEALLAKSPDDRPESAEVLLWKLTALRSGGPRASEPPSMSVLIIDDDPEICAVLKRALKHTFPRLEVEATTSPNEALRRVEQRTPDIALVDLNMPDINGIELCMHLRSLPEGRTPTVVAMSAAASDNDLLVLESLGIEHFVPKDTDFIARMCEVLGDLRRARRAALHPA
jgi:serine/threonine protein kinase